MWSKGRQRESEHPGQVSLLWFPLVFQCQEKGNVGTEIQQIKDAIDWVHFVSWQFSENVSCGKQYLVTVKQGSCDFKKEYHWYFFVDLHTCSLHDDPEPPCLILGS